MEYNFDFVTEEKGKEFYIQTLNEKQSEGLEKRFEIAKKLDLPFWEEMWEVGKCHVFGKGYFTWIYTKDADNKFDMKNFLTYYLSIDENLILESL